MNFLSLPERNYVLDDAGSLRVAQLSHSEFRPFTDVPPQVPAWQADRVPERISVPAGVWASPEQYRFKVPHRRAVRARELAPEWLSPDPCRATALAIR